MFTPSFIEKSQKDTDYELNDSKSAKIFSAYKRTRRMFSQIQIDILENIFEQTHYPDSSMRTSLSIKLNLSAVRIQVWFQNRRAKYRRLDNCNVKNLDRKK